MVSLEAWSFELTTILAGLISVTDLGAHTSMLGIIAFSFMSFPFPLSVASSIRVGNQLGANDPEGAKRTSKVAIMTMFVAMVFMVVSSIPSLPLTFFPGSVLISIKQFLSFR